jgi:hypothetical protein
MNFEVCLENFRTGMFYPHKINWWVGMLYKNAVMQLEDLAENFNQNVQLFS